MSEFGETEFWLCHCCKTVSLLARWVFKQLYDKGLVYRGVKVMPFSTACNTPLSNFESHQNYKVRAMSSSINLCTWKLKGCDHSNQSWCGLLAWGVRQIDHFLRSAGNICQSLNWGSMENKSKGFFPPMRFVNGVSSRDSFCLFWPHLCASLGLVSPALPCFPLVTAFGRGWDVSSGTLWYYSFVTSIWKQMWFVLCWQYYDLFSDEWNNCCRCSGRRVETGLMFTKVHSLLYLI